MVKSWISEMSKDVFHNIIISVMNIIILVIYIINFIIFVLSLSVFRIIVSISEFFAKPFSVSKHSVVLCLLMKLIPAKYNSKHENSSGAQLRPLCLSYQCYYGLQCCSSDANNIIIWYNAVSILYMERAFIEFYDKLSISHESCHVVSKIIIAFEMEPRLDETYIYIYELFIILWYTYLMYEVCT